MRALRAGGVIAMQATVAKNPSAMTKGAVSVGGSRPKWSIEMFPGEATVKKPSPRRVFVPISQQTD